MNIYELNDMIHRLETNPPSYMGDCTELIGFYKKKRKELMKTLSVGIQKIINGEG